MVLEKIISSGRSALLRGVLAGAVGISSFFAFNGNADETKVRNDIQKVDLCYSPFRDNQSPDKGVAPNLAELSQDMDFLPNLTRRIRVYGSTGTPAEIPSLCQKKGIECYVGAWIGKYNIENGKEMEGLIRIANSGLSSVKGAVIGNEVLLRKDIGKEEYKAMIKKGKSLIRIPVGIAETAGVLKENPDLADNLDFVFVHIYPFWDGKSVEGAAENTAREYSKIKELFPGKEVIIGETGWPSAGSRKGNAVPSDENQRKYFKEFMKIARERNIPAFYFSTFDENWKSESEGALGARWGLFNSNGSVKQAIRDLLPVEAGVGITRAPGKREVIRVAAPVSVYSEGGADEDLFQPTGWMGSSGNLENVIHIERDCAVNPHSGKTCLKLTYTPHAFDDWAGVYWQAPINNWGDYPGYNIEGARVLTFWARGEEGGERATFKIGGITGKKHRDSLGPIAKDVRLTKDWTKYTMFLDGSDTSNVIGGFCWATNQYENPRDRTTIYLDDIRFEK